MHTKLKTTAAVLALAACGWACRVGADAINTVIPAPALDTPAAEATGLQTAVLAGGCFWCMEHDMKGIKGVVSVESGYTGGHVDHPSYQDVTSETSGHYESVKVTFDPPTPGDVVYIEYPSGALYLEDPDGVARYRLMFNYLRAMALSPEDSRRLLARSADSHADPDLARPLRD